MTHRLAIIGFGKMGRAIAQLAPERGFEVVSRIDPHSGDAPAVTREALRDAEVAVEFSTPGTAVANVTAAIASGCPVVVGTTGWYEHRADVEKLAAEGGVPVLVAPNFSVGVAAFGEIVQAAARALGRAPGFDAHVVETHHTQKKDAPSGTAAALRKLAVGEWGRDIPITSIRTGSVPGTHEFVFDAPFEQIRIAHVARDRRVFADGALLAAQWLITHGRTRTAHGGGRVFSMQDVLRG